MLEKVKEIMAEQLRIDEALIRPDAVIGSLGADSLDILQLLMTIEEEYGITIPDEELASFEKVQDIVRYLEERM